MGLQITRRLACLCFGLATVGAAFALPARAAETDPEKFLGALAHEAVTVLRRDDLEPASRAQEFRKLLRRGFDLPAVSRFVLGRYWRRASELERDEFTQLFEDYVVAIYGRRLGHHVGAELRVIGHRSDGENGAIVHSEIAPGKGSVIKLDWRLRQRINGWRVVDIMVEGVSLALAQRSEFATVIRSNGGQVSGLLEKLRKKTQMLALNQGDHTGNPRPTNATISTQ
ncbi:MAG: ABC transporter substrate-binding protein [Rhodospirillaceae bacterium]|jgi:phospholipid transport system substrate-binding protein|nr:ABC transporter substrate-binding protein [Rhodospirillaceae bacterium]MBT5194157.1 ABC transporter substrate-binding protein [Rhodospirillaceae bacterium]MBT5897723.1 ABC transporter substrate-binding protein [Rhodospirillaceae bacterium]MBT6427396.1 ABC transporter substrate-binding protein [Rhodospirillaceae bacterium]MBT7755790.1 ABC transporter substrate-binding protein [Rhodospirillaceae bacterium]